MAEEKDNNVKGKSVVTLTAGQMKDSALRLQSLREAVERRRAKIDERKRQENQNKDLS